MSQPLYTKQYYIQHFSSNSKAEDWANEMWDQGYEVAGMTDTNSYCTIMVSKRKVEGEGPVS